MVRLAIVGAGVSGLAAAWALRREAAIDVAVFEKSRGVSGRAATRGRDGVRYDHGANYFKTNEHPRIDRLVRHELPAADLVDIGRDVWTFDGQGTISEGDAASNRPPKWTYRGGISTLGKLLAEASGAALHLETRVRRLVRSRPGWMIETTEGSVFEGFGAVLLTPPAPQAAALLEASDLGDTALQERLARALDAAAYRTQLTVVLAYDFEAERPGDFYALINTDGEHDIAWLSFERDKPGHVPAGQDVLIAQMAPAWSAPRFDAPLGDLIPEVARQAGALLGVDLGDPVWADRQGWRYALPDGGADAEALSEGRAAGLFFCGDALAGKGRVEMALASGLDAAAEIQARCGAER